MKPIGWQPCPCGSQETTGVVCEAGPHYARLLCDRCHRFIKWLPNPYPQGEHMGALKKLAGLWINESKKDGSKYMSGKLENGTKILIFKNTKKEPGSKLPDYQMYEAVEDAAPQAPAPAKPKPAPMAQGDMF